MNEYNYEHLSMTDCDKFDDCKVLPYILQEFKYCNNRYIVIIDISNVHFHSEHAKIHSYPAWVFSIYIWQQSKTATLFQYGNIWNLIKDESDINGWRCYNVHPNMGI